MPCFRPLAVCTLVGLSTACFEPAALAARRRARWRPATQQQRAQVKAFLYRHLKQAGIPVGAEFVVSTHWRRHRCRVALRLGAQRIFLYTEAERCRLNAVQLRWVGRNIVKQLPPQAAAVSPLPPCHAKREVSAAEDGAQQEGVADYPSSTVAVAGPDERNERRAPVVRDTPAPRQSETGPKAGASCDDDGRQTIAGHTFVASALTPWPFLTTHVGLGTRLERGTLETRTSGLEANSTTWLLALDLNVQVALARWIALRGRLLGGARFATDLEGALNFGAQLDYGFGLGVLTRVWGGRSWQLGLAGDFERIPGRRLAPLLAVLDLAADGQGTLVLPTSTMTALGGLDLAVAPHRSLGLGATARVGYEVTEVQQDSSGESIFSSSLTADWDLSALWRVVPLGIVLSYSTVLGLSRSAEAAHRVGWGLAYTGRPHLGLIVEGFVLARPKVSSPGLGAVLSMRYFW